MPIYVSHEELENAVATVRRHPTYQAAADALGIPVTTLKSRLKIASRRGLDLSVPPEGFEVASVVVREKDGQETGRTVHARPEREPYGVREGHAIKAESALLDADGRLVQRWIKTREDADLGEALLRAIQEAAAETIPQPTPAAPDTYHDRLLNVTGFADMHIGLLSWGKETGEDFDLGIAERAIDDIGAKLYAALPKAGRCIVAFTGDNVHAKDDAWRTNSGHELDGDGRHFKVLRVALRIMRREVLRALAHHVFVDVVVLRGNHEEGIARALGLALDAAFEQEHRVNVHVPEGDFWKHRFGTNLFVFNHFDKVDLKRLPLSIAVQYPVDWGETTSRHIIGGHFHAAKMEDIESVWCWTLPSMCARDSWIAGKNRHAVRGIRGLTFHEHDGYDGEVFRRMDFGKAT